MKAGQQWTAEEIRAEAERLAGQEQASFCHGDDSQGEPDKEPPVPDEEPPGPHVQFDSEFVLKCLSRNQIGDAEIFKRLHRGLFLYDHAAGQWYRWARHCWGQDRTESVVSAMQDVCRVYEIELQRTSWKANKARGEKDDK